MNLLLLMQPCLELLGLEVHSRELWGLLSLTWAR